MKIIIRLILIFVLSGCATTKDLKKLENQVAQQELESLTRDRQIIEMFQRLVDAYNRHLELLHVFPPKPESVNPEK